MPGIFGIFGGTNDTRALIHREFAAPWGGCETVEIGGGLLGGHAFPPALSLFNKPGSLVFAVDGEWSLYRAAQDFATGPTKDLFQLGLNGVTISPACKGNIIAFEPQTGRCYVATDWAGCFPLYYFHDQGRLVICSRLRPIAQATGAARDPIGILEFLRSADTLAGRTQFENVRRLLPGQTLMYHPTTDSLQVQEASQAWVGSLQSGSDSSRETAEAAWEALSLATARCLPCEDPAALMMSGGWDSRALLAACLANPKLALSCYSHGDLQSREVGLVKQICRDSNIAFHGEPLDDGLYDVSKLQRGFARVENVVFPHWHRAGLVLAESGAPCATAGVFGEVLGGHYGPAMLLQGSRKIAAIGKLLLGISQGGSTSEADFSAVCDLLRPKQFPKPWYVSRTFWESVPRAAEAVNADLEVALQRLADRGVEGLEAMIEAFVTEQRGSHYINAQVLSCRAELDVAIPYADQELFHLVTRVPLAQKVHNRLTQAMIRIQRPGLLRYSCAATLVPASYPLLLQETSRFVRHTWEDAWWRLHMAAPRLTAGPRLGWVNFEFLRTGKALGGLVDDLRCDLWDRQALRACIQDVVQRRWKESAHPISDAFMKVYTADLLLR